VFEATTWDDDFVPGTGGGGLLPTFTSDHMLIGVLSDGRGQAAADLLRLASIARGALLVAGSSRYDAKNTNTDALVAT